jgi:hypothetical protein
MRLMFQFPSDTNEMWFLDFVETHMPQYIANCARYGGEIIVTAVPEYERNRMIAEGKDLGAFITEGDTRMMRVL